MAKMNHQRKPAAQEYATLAESEVTYSRADAGKAIAAVQDLPLELPAGGKYQVSARGKELHVEELTSGISSFRTTDASRIGAISYNVDIVEIAYRSKAFDKIVLHTAPGAADPRSITAEQENIVKHLEEYDRIKTKSKLTGKDAKRLIELMEIIRGQCAHEACEAAGLAGSLPPRPEPEPKKPSRRTSNGPQTSGESRGYSSSPESRGAHYQPVSGESRGSYAPSGESRGSHTTTGGESRGGPVSSESRGGATPASTGESRGASSGESRASHRPPPSSGESRGFGRTAG